MQFQKQTTINKKFWRKYTIILSTLGILFVSSLVILMFISKRNQLLASNSSWQEFSSSEDHFKAIFPALPKYKQQSVPLQNSNLPLETNKYSSNFNNINYTIAVEHYPLNYVTAKTPDTFLESVLDGILSIPNTNLIKSNFLDVDNHKAVDFFAENNNLSISGRLILVNKSESDILLDVYQILVISEKNTGAVDYKKFFDSFKLL